jgi:hypothetical protein
VAIERVGKGAQLPGTVVGRQEKGAVPSTERLGKMVEAVVDHHLGDVLAVELGQPRNSTNSLPKFRKTPRTTSRVCSEVQWGKARFRFRVAVRRR